MNPGLLDSYLEEKHEGHPLVVGVIPLLMLALHIVPHGWVHHVGAHGLVHLVGKGERGCYPAIRIYHVTRYSPIVDAVDGVACGKERVLIMG